jgi:hypothetical protein
MIDSSEECFIDCSQLNCICCGKKTWDFEGALLPYGSDYDQEIICNFCMIKIVDPYVKERRKYK